MLHGRVYPGASAVRVPVRYLEGTDNALVNPTIGAEVLSPSTGLHDRTDKFAKYKTI